MHGIASPPQGSPPVAYSRAAREDHSDARSHFLGLHRREPLARHLRRGDQRSGARIAEHREKSIAGFTARYNVTRLVYFEQYDRAADAIAREKQLKGWTRAKKIALIERDNRAWSDLSGE